MSRPVIKFRSHIERCNALGLCRLCLAPTTKTKCAACLARYRYQRYRFSPEEETLCVQALATHNGTCDSCGVQDPGGPNWHIDHCHKTNRFRGLLCAPCNLILGLANDRVSRLKRVIEYLRNNK